MHYSQSDFKIIDLINSSKPISLYLAVPPSDLSRLKPLIRLILNQTGRILTEEMGELGDKKIKNELLWLLDEFPSLGRLDFFESALAYMAGYGLRAFLITQSLNQIEKVYGPNNSILDNCHIRVAFASNDERTARRISDLLGVQTAVKDQQSLSGPRNSMLLRNMSVSKQEFARPLLTPDEVMQLPNSKELIFTASTPPILANKIIYYEDENLKNRILTPPPSETKSQNTENPWSNEKGKAIEPESDDYPLEAQKESTNYEKGIFL